MRTFNVVAAAREAARLLKSGEPLADVQRHAIIQLLLNQYPAKRTNPRLP